MKAAVNYVAGLPACNGRVAVGGFCWGGRETFRFACNNPDIAAAFVFYGDAPSAERFAFAQSGELEMERGAAFHQE